MIAVNLSASTKKKVFSQRRQECLLMDALNWKKKKEMMIKNSEKKKEIGREEKESEQNTSEQKRKIYDGSKEKKMTE